MRLVLLVLVLLFASGTSAQASVRCVQEFLAQTAFDPGPVDGAWGKKTAQALEEYFAQIGETAEGGLGQGNAAAVCETLSGPRHDELLARGAYRIYSVAVDLSQVAGAEDQRRAFDFSKFDVATDAYFDRCNFKIVRLEDGSRSDMASGELSISGGSVYFGTHRWFSGGTLADETYLAEQSNLRVATDGTIVGRMPYFHLFRDPGEVDEPPRYMTLSDSYEPGDVFPNGVSKFAMNEDGFDQKVDVILTCRPN